MDFKSDQGELNIRVSSADRGVAAPRLYAVFI